MKKFIRILAIVLCFAFCAQVSALAVDQSTAAVVGTAGMTAAIAAENAYETSVVARMTGRAGAKAPTGSKGISFEVLYTDLMNFIKNPKGSRTALSASSIDNVADVFTIDASGNTTLYQLKSGTSSTNTRYTVEQMRLGKYEGIGLVGTRESSALINEEAAAKGITQRATNSGISDNTISRFADRALCNTPSASQVFNQTVKVSGAAAGVAALVSLAESIYCEHNLYEATGNIVENSLVSGTSVAMASVVTAEMPALLGALGVSATAASAATTVVGLLVPVAAGYVLYMIADEYGFEERVAEAMEQVVATVSEFAGEVKVTVVEWDIPEKASSVWSSAVDSGAVAVDTVAAFGVNAWGHITNAASTVVETVSSILPSDVDPNSI